MYILKSLFTYDKCTYFMNFANCIPHMSTDQDINLSLTQKVSLSPFHQSPFLREWLSDFYHHRVLPSVFGLHANKIIQCSVFCVSFT